MMVAFKSDNKGCEICWSFRDRNNFDKFIIISFYIIYVYYINVTYNIYMLDMESKGKKKISRDDLGF